MTATGPRVEPVPPPFPPELQAVFDRIMPPGIPPFLVLVILALNVFLVGGLSRLSVGGAFLVASVTGISVVRVRCLTCEQD